jgi:integrase
MKTREDFRPDITPPRSIQEIVEEQISYTTYNGKTSNQLECDSIEVLLHKVYEHIERQALQIYKSNELWALKSYAYSHILDDATRQAAIDDDTLLPDLVSGLAEWQKTEFDPILNLKRKLLFSGRKDEYYQSCAVVARWFVTKYGKKKRYKEEEILEFLDWLDKHYEKPDKHGRETSSYVTRVTQLKRFLECLPEDEQTGKKQIVPFEVPQYPQEFDEPSFTHEEIDKLTYSAVMSEKPDVVLRLAIATIYGCRLGEVADLSSDNINLNHDYPTIMIPTKKKGKRKPQPIPTELLPLFSIPLTSKNNYKILRDLRRVCRKAGVKYLRGYGVHCIRRSVVTALFDIKDLKELTIHRFLRWSTGMGMGVMPRYVKTPPEVTDVDVLSKHPYIPIWRELVLFMPYLPQYEPYLNVRFNTNMDRNK